MRRIAGVEFPDVGSLPQIRAAWAAASAATAEPLRLELAACGGTPWGMEVWDAFLLPPAGVVNPHTLVWHMREHRATPFLAPGPAPAGAPAAAPTGC